MTSASLIPIVLVLLVGATIVSLLLDARLRRVQRHIDIAMPAAQAASLVSIRRSEVKSRWHLLHRLTKYRPEVTYTVHPAYVVLAGFLAAMAVVYANRFVGLSASTVWILAVIVGVLVVRGLLGWQQRRLALQLFRQLPDVVQIVTSTVRSGLPVNEAFRTIARDLPQPTAGQFAIVCNELSLGRSPEEAIEAVYRRTHVAEYAMFAVTLAVQLKSGGSLAETLQTLGETVRQRVALAARAKALAAEVIFSSRALSLAPILIGGLLYWINPSSINMLFTDPTGNMLLVYAVSSVLMGHLVIRWLIRRETSL